MSTSLERKKWNVLFVTIPAMLTILAAGMITGGILNANVEQTLEEAGGTLTKTATMYSNLNSIHFPMCGINVGPEERYRLINETFPKIAPQGASVVSIWHDSHNCHNGTTIVYTINK